ncbi:MAG: hypothetical protein PVF83_15580 [Anaerolineales bacterium]
MKLEIHSIGWKCPDMLQPVASGGISIRCKEAGSARYRIQEVVSTIDTINAGGTTSAPLVLLEGGTSN